MLCENDLAFEGKEVALVGHRATLATVLREGISKVFHMGSGTSRTTGSLGALASSASPFSSISRPALAAHRCPWGCLFS